MQRNYLLLCLFSIAAYFVTGTVASEAVVGGILARGTQFPYLVSLRGHDNRHICGGSIIHHRHILTAAHCVIRSDWSIRDRGMRVVAGTTNLLQIATAVVKEVDSIYIPPLYNPRTKQSDIAVLKLQSSYQHLHLGHLDQIALNWNNDESHVGKKLFIAGYSNNSFMHPEDFDHKLTYSETIAFDVKTCLHFYKKHGITIPENEVICSRIQMLRNNQRYVCVGDDGGPLVFNRTIIGVLSIYEIPCNVRNEPSIYTRVSRYTKFIQEVITGTRAPYAFR